MSEQLTAAMDRVDAIGGAGEPFGVRTSLAPLVRIIPPGAVSHFMSGAPDAPPARQEAPSPPQPDPIEALAVAGASRPLKAATLRSVARTAVALAMEAGGQDPRHWRTADALTAENIERLLTDVMDAATVEMPVAFRQSSAPADVSAAQAVAKAIAGGA